MPSSAFPVVNVHPLESRSDDSTLQLERMTLPVL